jgi:hypothetical protein
MLELLNNSLNQKSPLIEDLHLRIKTDQEEYEEILLKRIQDISKIKNLEETIFIIKKKMV